MHTFQYYHSLKINTRYGKITCENFPNSRWNSGVIFVKMEMRNQGIEGEQYEYLIFLNSKGRSGACRRG